LDNGNCILVLIHMKYLAIIIILFASVGAVFLPVSAKAKVPVSSIKAVETYRVLKVVGKVSIEKAKVNLKIGDQFNSNDKLKFHSPNAQVAVVTNSRRRKVFSASSEGLKQPLLQTLAQKNVTMRSGGIINTHVLSKHFSDTVLLLNKIKLAIEIPEFEQNQDNFYYMEFKHEGSTIAKKLPHDGNQLLIYRDSLFMIDDVVIAHPVLTQMTLKFRKVKSNSSVMIGEFMMATPSLAEIMAQLDVFSTEWSDTKFENKELLTEAVNHLGMYYGKTTEEDMKRFYLNR